MISSATARDESLARGLRILWRLPLASGFVRPVVESRHMKKPNELTAQDWAALAAVDAVVEAWGLEDADDPAKWLSEEAYGVRFDYQTDGPGYVGPLYLLQGAGAPETAPMTLIEGEHGLKVVGQY